MALRVVENDSRVTKSFQTNDAVKVSFKTFWHCSFQLHSSEFSCNVSIIALCVRVRGFLIVAVHKTRWL